MTFSLRPDIRLQPGRHKRALEGHPWVYSNEIEMTAEAKALPRGTVARFVSHDNRPLGAGFFDAHSLIAGRLLERDGDAQLDTAWLTRRISRALALRQRLFAEPHYRVDPRMALERALVAAGHEAEVGAERGGHGAPSIGGFAAFG